MEKKTEWQTMVSGTMKMESQLDPDALDLTSGVFNFEPTPQSVKIEFTMRPMTKWEIFKAKVKRWWRGLRGAAVPDTEDDYPPTCNAPCTIGECLEECFWANDHVDPPDDLPHQCSDMHYYDVEEA